jgi:serine/threonine protein kinase
VADKGEMVPMDVSPHHVDSNLGKTLTDTYRLLRLLGQGGMGRVYEASHTRLSKKRYAVKILQADAAADPEAYARFRREAEITTEIGHPHIVEVYDFNITSDGQPFIVMQLLAGENLFDYLQRRGRLPRAELLRILRQVCSGLAAAHEAGIVHRDLKPENIFLAEQVEGDPQAKLLDFGLSKIKHSNSQLTQQDAIFGTPHYMAPEQADASRGTVDQRSDIYALGVIVYQCLCGDVPFDAPTPLGVLYKALNSVPERLTVHVPQLPAEIDQVVAKAMAKQQAERYPTVEAFLQEIAPILERPGIVGATRQPPRPRQAEPHGGLKTLVRHELGRAPTLPLGAQAESMREPPEHREAPREAPEASEGKTIERETWVLPSEGQLARARAARMVGLAALLGGAVVLALVLAFCGSTPTPAPDGEATRATSGHAPRPSSPELAAAQRGQNTGVANAGGADTGGADAGGADAGGADAGGADAGAVDVGGADVGGADVRAADAGGANLQTADAGVPDQQRAKNRKRPRRVRQRRSGWITVATIAGERKIWAKVYLDGQFIGRSLIYRKRCKAGRHVVVARRPGYADVRRVVRVRPRRLERIVLRFERLEDR